jgi:hypothetical protein
MRQNEHVVVPAGVESIDISYERVGLPLARCEPFFVVALQSILGIDPVRGAWNGDQLSLCPRGRPSMVRGDGGRRHAP